jgi:NADH dehydrogenase FAD-containing subunit
VADLHRRRRRSDGDGARRHAADDRARRARSRLPPHRSEERTGDLVEGGPKILPTYPDELSEHARRDLTNLGVDVRTGTLVSEIGPHHVVAGGERIHAHTILWAAGNTASSLGGI